MEAGRELTDAGRRDRDGGIAVGELELRGRYLRAVGRRQGTGQALRTGRLLVVTRKSRRRGRSGPNRRRGTRNCRRVLRRRACAQQRGTGAQKQRGQDRRADSCVIAVIGGLWHSESLTWRSNQRQPVTTTMTPGGWSDSSGSRSSTAAPSVRPTASAVARSPSTSV